MHLSLLAATRMLPHALANTGITTLFNFYQSNRGKKGSHNDFDLYFLGVEPNFLVCQPFAFLLHALS